VSSPEIALRQCWRSLAGGGYPATIDSLLAHHREPHRHYHTAVHVMWVLRHVHDLLATAPEDVDADAVRAAALFHDVIYEPTSSTNEHDSATFATDALTPLGWHTSRLERVAELIEATAGHAADGPDAEVLLDADLATLGSSPAEYQAYVTGVRAEYAHVGPDAWRSGRAAVLRSFLDRPTIYATPTMRAAREPRARANLAAELATLEPTTRP
jgi:predicted metal-dependent HD superfamily phosphohydrolase